MSLKSMRGRGRHSAALAAAVLAKPDATKVLSAGFTGEREAGPVVYPLPGRAGLLRELQGRVYREGGDAALIHDVEGRRDERQRRHRPALSAAMAAPRLASAQATPAPLTCART